MGKIGEFLELFKSKIEIAVVLLLKKNKLGNITRKFVCKRTAQAMLPLLTNLDFVRSFVLVKILTNKFSSVGEKYNKHKEVIG